MHQLVGCSKLWCVLYYDYNYLFIKIKRNKSKEDYRPDT